MKINKRLRKAFTLVELVVVIAIIAILSTVSVVTYFGITNSAKKSVDDTLITELNKCLQLDETINGKPNTPSEALEVVEENGFTVEKMTPTQDKKEIVWHQTTNKFELVDEIIIQSKIKNAEGTTNISTWRFLSEYTSNGGYSIYLKDADFSGEALTLNITTGLDVGKNTEDFNITYESTSGNEVTIRTNGGTLTVDSANSDNLQSKGFPVADWSHQDHFVLTLLHFPYLRYMCLQNPDSLLPEGRGSSGPQAQQEQTRRLLQGQKQHRKWHIYQPLLLPFSGSPAYS